MLNYYENGGVCLCPVGVSIQGGASRCEKPFSPLVFLVWRDPFVSRGIFAIHEPSEFDEPEGPGLLLPPIAAELDPEADEIIRRDGACVLNTAFSRCFSVLASFLNAGREGYRLNVAGLGDVGGTVLTGLVLLGREIAQIGVFDYMKPQVTRYCTELNQILPPTPGQPTPLLFPCPSDDLFRCDAFLFTASGSIPSVKSGIRDVRMAQLSANRSLLRAYARQARDSGFSGIFCQISDPVDLLARYVFLESNRDENGNFDWRGLLPEQVRGFGLGVMEARARYVARERKVDFSCGEVYGPHGADLIVANDPGEGYDDELSRQLSEETATINMRLRQTGFKPYIAPGLSSAAISILAMLRGQEHASAVPIDGAYFGCHSWLTPLGPVLRRADLHPALVRRITEVHRKLKEFPVDG